MTGQYWGEMLIGTNLAHGRGVFRTNEGIIYARYFNNGAFGEGSSLQFNSNTQEGGLFKNLRGRGKLIDYGNVYKSDGSTQSGYF